MFLYSTNLENLFIQWQTGQLAHNLSFKTHHPPARIWISHPICWHLTSLKPQQTTPCILTPFPWKLTLICKADPAKSDYEYLTHFTDTPPRKSLSRVQLFATPWTVAYKALLSMGFSRQEYWSGLPFPSPGDLPHPGIEPGSPAL